MKRNYYSFKRIANISVKNRAYWTLSNVWIINYWFRWKLIPFRQYSLRTRLFVGYRPMVAKPVNIILKHSVDGRKSQGVCENRYSSEFHRKLSAHNACLLRFNVFSSRSTIANIDKSFLRGKNAYEIPSSRDFRSTRKFNYYFHWTARGKNRRLIAA